MIRNLTVLLIIVVLLIIGLTRYHLESVKAMNTQSVALFHWEDTTATAAIRQVSQFKTFEQTMKQRHNFGYSESIHWFRFHLNTNNLPKELSLEIRNPGINHLEVFAVSDGKITSLGQSGDWLPFRQRPTPTKTFVYPIYQAAYEEVDYYLKIDKRYENLSTEIYLWNASDFENKDQREYFLWGLFSGIVLLIVLLNLFFWRTTQDRVYLWYGVYLVGLSLRQFADSGLSFQYFWPDFPNLNHPDPVIQALWIYLPALIQFQQNFLEIRKESRWLFIATQFLKYFYIIGFTGLLLLQLFDVPRQYTWSQFVLNYTHAFASLINLIVFILIILKGIRLEDPLKKIYCIGFAFQLSGQLLIIIQSIFRFRPDGIFFIDSYLILTLNFFFDLVVFSYLLAYRYRKSIVENRALQLSLVQTQQEANRQIIEVLTYERGQVRAMLRDEVGQRLVQAREELKDVKPSPMLTDAMLLIQKANEDLDTIAHNVLPIEFAEKGLIKCLSEITQRLNETQSIRFEFLPKSNVQKMSVVREVQIYRIANELINNILKHSHATQAHIILTYESAQLRLVVVDNGRGFDTKATNEMTAGIGVRNLHARTRELNAEVTMESGNNGTKITLQVPYS